MKPKTFKPKRCKVGKEMFTPIKFGQPTCFEHAGQYLRQQKAKKLNQTQKEQRKVMKENIKTRTEYLKELETAFNAYIRERDKNLPCISCGATSGFRPTAGHYFPTTHGSVRFHEDNVNMQCWFNCNKNKHGNLAEYLPNLIKKIGQKRFDAMSKIKNQETLHLSIPEIIELKTHYKQLIKEIQ